MSESVAETNGPGSLAEIRETMHAVGEQVRGIAAETAKAKKEADRRQEEADRRQRELDRRHKEADRGLAEIRLIIQETALQMKETDRRLKKAEDLFTSQWGKLIESLVEGDLVRLLRDRGIAVHTTYQHRKGRFNGEHTEIDIVATNGAEAVVVEVKTTLRPEDVKEFLTKLSFFTEWFPEHRRERIYGAVAYLKGHESVTKHAERQGLFVIRATGNSASIVNGADFKPRVFS